MKRENRIMRAGLVFAMLLFVGLVNATKLEKMESKPYDLLVSSDLEFFVSYQLGDVQEAELDIEDWMLDTEGFEEKEEWQEELVMEEWMFDVMAFLLDEDEEELDIEDWMTDVSAFVGELDNVTYALK